MARTALLVLLTSALVLVAAQQSPHSHTNVAVNAGPEWTEMQASMARMHEGMAAVRPSGNNDLDFVRLMLPHHQGAIDMAKAELLYGKDPQMRRLAQEIIADQQSEIDLMQLWLKQHASATPVNAHAAPAGDPR
ncbi:MAG: DUF305 domain-containing protein [Terriglobales bacterium]